MHVSADGQSVNPERISTFVSAQRDVLEQLDLAVRRMGAQSVVTSQVVSARFGLHTTDLEVLDLISHRGRVSAGELAQATGLTTGSVTALIDRLARAGYVERQTDPNDRRRVIVAIRRDAVAPIEAVYAPMQSQMMELWSTYDVAELKTIVDFITRSTDLAVVCVQSIQQTDPPASSKRRPSRARARPAD
jgi:DNA-binding MarR family transcriptional regulator